MWSITQQNDNEGIDFKTCTEVRHTFFWKIEYRKLLTTNFCSHFQVIHHIGENNPAFCKQYAPRNISKYLESPPPRRGKKNGKTGKGMWVHLNYAIHTWFKSLNMHLIMYSIVGPIKLTRNLRSARAIIHVDSCTDTMLVIKNLKSLMPVIRYPVADQNTHFY